MKNIIAILLVAVMALGMVACGNENAATPTTTAPAGTTTDTTPADTTPEESVPGTEEIPTTEAPVVAAENEASKVLSAVWAQFPEDQKFFAMGGDFNNMVNEAPGVAEDAEFIEFSLLVPNAELTNIAEAASLMHGMNANTFTCGAYKLAEGADAAAFATAMQNAIQNNQWMCGFPELLLIADVNGVVVVAFGLGDAINPFQTALTAAYADAQVLVNEAIGG